jgi:Tol biopolymer transport system component
MTVLARAASVLAFVCLASSSSVAQALVLASRAPDGTPGDSISQHPAISADGRWVVFVSSASNLVVGDDNGREDLFRFDRLTGRVERAGLGSQGLNGYSDVGGISADGRYAAFSSIASNISPGDTNNAADVFVFDFHTQQLTRIDGIGGTLPNGFSNQASMSDDGRFVAFASGASNLTAGDTNASEDVFLYDATTREVQLISRGIGGAPTRDSSGRPVVSGDGRYVAFASRAWNLVPPLPNAGFTNVYLWDRLTVGTVLVSVAPQGGPDFNYGSFWGVPSDNGLFVAFASDVATVVPGDTNGVSDVFVRDLSAGTTQRVSTSAAGQQGNGASGFAHHLSMSAAQCNRGNLFSGTCNTCQWLWYCGCSGPAGAPPATSRSIVSAWPFTPAPSATFRP